MSAEAEDPGRPTVCTPPPNTGVWPCLPTAGQPTDQAGPLSPWIEMAEEQYQVDRESRPVQPSSLREELQRPGRPNL